VREAILRLSWFSLIKFLIICCSVEEYKDKNAIYLYGIAFVLVFYKLCVKKFGIEYFSFLSG
jgi:hypothetical protein